MLSLEDRKSTAWSIVSRHCQKRIDDLRRSNDNPNLGEGNTAVIRGEIAGLKRFLIEMAPDKTDVIEELEDEFT